MPAASRRTDPSDLAAFEELVRLVGAAEPDSLQYQALSQLVLTHDLAERLLTLDPFSAEYRDTVLRMHADLRRSDRAYEPALDETSGLQMPDDLVRGVSPWAFQDPRMVSEFFFSWGQILKALDLPPASQAKVLEYGSGSGQLLLFMARLGLRPYAVDIDAASLELVRAQAAALGVAIETEQAEFGRGFDGQTFDRIIFFEAFHHSVDFIDLLKRLHGRLNPGGFLILCGEPIVGTAIPPVPYPWGARLDGLSVFCMRRHGWMELGFTEPFLIEAFQRCGWEVEVTHFPGCGRANTYVARPYLGTSVEIGRTRLRLPDAGWEMSEGTHRWTHGGVVSRLPLPDLTGPCQVTLRVGNLSHKPMAVRIFDGETVRLETVLEAASADCELRIGTFRSASVGIWAEGFRPKEQVPHSTDERFLGVTVLSMRVDSLQ